MYIDVLAIPSADIISNGTSEPNASNEEPPKDEDDGKTIRFISFYNLINE